MIKIEALKLWAEFEPMRCRWQNGDYDQYIRVLVGDHWHRLVRYPNDYPEFAEFHLTLDILVEAAVREAILARGWGFKLSNVFDEVNDSPIIEGSFSGHVFISDNDEYVSKIFWSDDDTPAESLLTAYLNALADQANAISEEEHAATIRP